MSAHFRPIILNAFPEATWSPILKCTARGVALADSLIREQRWLCWPVGRDQRGDLRRAGIMWSLREACAVETLPFQCHDRQNSAKNCHHIEIESQNLSIHVNHTEWVTAMPRDTKLRNDARAQNQLDLFKPAILTTDLREIKKWYGSLTFNADDDGKLTHLAIGLPEEQGSDWLDLLPLPLGSDGAFISDDEEPEPLGPDKLVKFRDEIKKMLEPPTDQEEAEGGEEGA